MRLWSLHPKYLDRQGLLAVWREGLLAQSVLLKGEYKECPVCLNSCDNGGWYKFTNQIYYVRCLKCKGTGKIKTPWYNHPQLDRFKIKDGLNFLKTYLLYIWKEANLREYNFDKKKIKKFLYRYRRGSLTVTMGQLIYEFEHLQHKLYKRNNLKCQENYKEVGIGLPLLQNIEPHPLFNVIEGERESWEKGKLQEIK